MKILSKKGMSMVQVLIGSAMVAGIALVLAQLGLDSSKVQRGSLINAEIVQITNMVEKLMLNNQACVNTFNGVNFSSTTLQDVTSIMDFGTPTEPTPGRAIYTAGNDIGGNLTLTSMQAQRGTGNLTNSWPTNEVRLFLTLTKKNEDEVRRSMGAQTIVKNFNINVQLNSSSNVESCYSDFGNYVDDVLKQVCTRTDFHGATWNSGTRSCSTSAGFRSFLTVQANRNSNGTLHKWAYDYDFCALAQARGEDAWKKSTARACTITRSTTNPKNWRLTSWLEEGRHNHCRMYCFRL